MFTSSSLTIMYVHICALSEKLAHSTVYLHLSDYWAVITQLGYWLRWWYTVEWAECGVFVYFIQIKNKNRPNRKLLLLLNFGSCQIVFPFSISHLMKTLWIGSLCYYTRIALKCQVLNMNRLTRMWPCNSISLICFEPCKITPSN